MFSHPCVKVMCDCCPVLCTSRPAWPCSNFAYILGLSSQALACLVGACDIIDDIGVFTGDALLHWPRLSSQGARVCICVGRINATQTPGLSTLFEAWTCSPTCTLPSVHWGQLGSHKDVSQVGRSQVRHHGSSCHPLLHTGVPLHQKVVVLVQDAGGVRQSSVEGERQDDWSLLLWPHHFLHHLLPRPQEHRLELILGKCDPLQ